MTAPERTVRVYGAPVPQGSKVLRQAGGRAWMMDSRPRPLAAWRAAVADAWRAESLGTITGAVALQATFLLPRPRGHYGTGRNADRLKPSAPDFPAVKPDVDKLLRAIMDALTDAEAWEDDARVVSVEMAKVYASAPERAGVLITIRPMNPTPQEAPQ